MSDIPASSSHATKAMEAAREIYWGSDWKEPYPLESQMSPEQILALNDMAAIISKYMPPSVPVIGVKEGESLWLIEQTDEEGTRRFWAGYYWSTSALDAVRFTEYSAAWGLVCFPWWPEVGNPPRRYEKVDVCEHLFQCGIAPEQSVPAGWKLVPLIPTKDMIEASCKGPGMTMINNMLSAYQIRAGLIDEKAIKFRDDGKPAIQEAYEAMLAVAPEPKEKP